MHVSAWPQCAGGWGGGGGAALVAAERRAGVVRGVRCHLTGWWATSWRRANVCPATADETRLGIRSSGQQAGRQHYRGCLLPSLLFLLSAAAAQEYRSIGTARSNHARTHALETLARRQTDTQTKTSAVLRVRWCVTASGSSCRQS